MDAQPSQPERPASLIAAPYIRAFLMRVLQEEREREAQHGAEAQAQEDQRREVERRAEEKSMNNPGTRCVHVAASANVQSVG